MSDTVVDTCCLVNLCAVDEPLRFLPAVGLAWHVPKAVAAEGLFIREEEDGGRAKKRQIELEPCFAAGVVVACDVTSAQETELYVELARELDDGEAMALAIAKARNWTVATDDRQGRRKARELSVPVLTTPELMRRWSTVNSVPPDEVGRALLRIQRLARFVPSADFPDFPWWVEVLSDSRG